MILYFADRKMNIIGQASTELPEGLTVCEDLKTEDTETGVATFECKIPFNKKMRSEVERCAEVGNYILRSHEAENEFYTIIETEIDTKNQEVYIYAEDAGLDLLNEVVGEYAADKAYPINHYINKFAYDSGFEIGINEAKNLTRKLSWDGEATATERIASVATQFGNFEVSYSFKIDGLTVVKKYINIFKKRGKDNGVQLRLNKEIDSIVTSKSIANLATALKCEGGTPEEAENPINLKGYKYDDGDIYVGSDGILRSRTACKKWSRYVWNLEPNKIDGYTGNIVKAYSYDTTSQQELCNRAITELKKIREIEVNYEVDISKLPDNVKIGDRVNIIDDAGELYLSTRILQLETSVADKTHKATLGEHLIKGSGISQRVIDLAAQFAKTSHSAARALSIANAAKTAANNAQTQADAAVTDAANAKKAAADATAAANTAQESAGQAQTAAANAQAAVETVVENVTALETTIENAQAAAENAYKAAETAQQKADEAATAAANAATDAEQAQAAAETAQTTANGAVTKAEAAQATAETAKTEATAAKETATAAKADAEQAQKDIDALGDNLTTLSQTMSVEYARKTDLTEAEANLQSQITQNAAQIATTVAKVQIIDETANSAQEQAQAAKTAAVQAQAQADEATAEAEAAQAAADEAQAAAESAQAEADTAQAAADEAQRVADTAAANLAAAQAELEEIEAKADATEEEIAAARAAVEEAQAAVNQANADSQAAAETAAAAQSVADTAMTNALNAQSAANSAASNAALSQKIADDATAAHLAAVAAEFAAATAAKAQRTADNAVTAAEAAQAEADTAAANVIAAQNAVNAANEKVQAAAADLEAAQENLENVKAQVGATVEEVEAAQAAVDEAQAAANQANKEAREAQAAANTARTNAINAQTAADEAQTAAENAQAAAADAQTAADDAQAAVDALAKRVTEAETSITQTSEQIALMATKTEVTETLGGYYTKTEADAAFKVKADEISINMSSQQEQINSVNGNLQNFVNTFSKYIKFTSETALTIGSGDSAITLEIDNETGIVFKKNGEQFGWWDGVDFHTGNIVVEVNERAQLGNFAFVPRSDGSLSFLKVKG